MIGQRVWIAEYCFCTYEGGFTVLAVCSTRKKARETIKSHKASTMEWRYGKPFTSEDWRVKDYYIDSLQQ